MDTIEAVLDVQNGITSVLVASKERQSSSVPSASVPCGHTSTIELFCAEAKSEEIFVLYICVYIKRGY